MSAQHPDRDSLTAYIEETLSIDATQWVARHLAGCAACQAKLEQERRLLARLDGLRSVAPPEQFVSGVMARVAQYPAHQPPVQVPWRKAAVWAGSVAAMLLVSLGLVGWLLVSQSPLDSAEASGYASTGIAMLANTATDVYLFASAQLDKAPPVWQVFTTLFVGVLGAIREAGLFVQLAVLLITVAINYFFTRMVLNYQRRH